MLTTGSSTHALQTVRTLKKEFAWQSGIMKATRFKHEDAQRQADLLALHQVPGRAEAQLVCSTLQARWPQQSRLSISCWAGCLQMQLPAGIVPWHSCRVGPCQEPRPTQQSHSYSHFGQPAFLLMRLLGVVLHLWPHTSQSQPTG